MVLPLLIPIAIRIAAEVLPTLAAKIAGDRAGEVAREVVETATVAAGLPRDSKPEEVIAALRANAAALEEVRYKFELLNQQEHERILEDRRSAREYQLKAGPWRGNVMLIGVVIGLTLCVVAIVWPRDPATPLNSAEIALLSTIAGALLKMLSDAFAYEFGSSRGSKEKDEQLRDFKDALVRVGEERQSAAREIIRNQQEDIRSVAKTAVKSAAAAAGGVRPPDPAAPEATTRPPRDFVAELLGGRVA